MTAQWPSWLGFCHNDTQYGNMLLHTASPLTAEQQADMDDHMHVGTPPLYDSLPEDLDARGLRIKTSPVRLQLADLSFLRHGRWCIISEPKCMRLAHQDHIHEQVFPSDLLP